MERPSVYDYLDYRSFLSDMFNFRKSKNAAFSYRYFSSKAGFASPNFLKLVSNGQRNLTNGSIAKVAKGFGLKKKEREFFENLVYMNQAVTHDEKNHYYCKLVSIIGGKKSAAIDKRQYDYFSKWYYPAIRELIAFKNGMAGPETIAAQLHPKVPLKEVLTAIDLLESLGLIEKRADGRWQQVHRNVSTGSEIKSLVVVNFHKEMMRLAAEAIDHVPPKRRDISALTLSVQRDTLLELKDRIIAFRKELMEMASADDAPDTVVQINIQLFPLTK